jgi:hypothetical protein
MTKQMQVYIDTLYAFLVNSKKAFVGNSYDLADAAGIPHDWLRRVLNTVRTPEWVDDHGWTIPYVSRGRAWNAWTVVDTQAHPDNVRMRASQRRRAEEMLRTTERNIGQATLALASITDKRKSAAIRWRHVTVALEATKAHLEALLMDWGSKNTP